MAGVAIAGATETAILTYSKVTNTPIASVVGDLCTSREACTHVLDGPYATIPFLNVPLSALGCVAYTTVALLAIAPTLGNIITTTTNNSNTNTNSNSYSNNNKDQTATSTSSNGNDDANARQLLLLLTSGMAAFSVYLMVVLGVVVQESCVFCYTRYTPLLLLLLLVDYNFLTTTPPPPFTHLPCLLSSAALSLSLAALAWSQRIVPRPNQVIHCPPAFTTFSLDVFSRADPCTLLRYTAYQ